MKAMSSVATNASTMVKPALRDEQETRFISRFLVSDAGAPYRDAVPVRSATALGGRRLAAPTGWLDAGRRNRRRTAGGRGANHGRRFRRTNFLQAPPPDKASPR